MSNHLDGPCCPSRKWQMEKAGSSTPVHDPGCIWREATTPWERIAKVAIDAAMDWWEKRQATLGGKR